MPEETEEFKQCRICLDGEDLELGRLIRPCLCKGSISYVHVKCLHRWRNSSASQSAFYACPQCKYRYHFARTRVMGIATNPLVIAPLSAFFFTILVLLSSFVTTYLMGNDDNSMYTFSVFYPVEVFQNLVRTTIGMLVDDNMLDGAAVRRGVRLREAKQPRAPPGFFGRLFQRFLLGLPVVGAGSIAHLLFSIPLPFHWLRFRARRTGRESKDLMALIILAVVIAGAARALYKVYRLTESMTKRMLLRAEEAILEVG